MTWVVYKQKARSRLKLPCLLHLLPCRCVNKLEINKGRKKEGGRKGWGFQFVLPQALLCACFTAAVWFDSVLGSHLVLRGTSSPCTQFSSYIIKFLMHPTNPLLLLQTNKKTPQRPDLFSNSQLMRIYQMEHSNARRCSFPINLSHSHRHCCSRASSTDQPYHNPSYDYHTTVCLGVFTTSPPDHQRKILKENTPSRFIPLTNHTIILAVTTIPQSI